MIRFVILQGSFHFRAAQQAAWHRDTLVCRKTAGGGISAVEKYRFLWIHYNRIFRKWL